MRSSSILVKVLVAKSRRKLESLVARWSRATSVPVLAHCNTCSQKETTLPREAAVRSVAGKMCSLLRKLASQKSKTKARAQSSCKQKLGPGLREALQRSSTAKEDGLTFAEMQKQYGVLLGVMRA